MATPSTTVFNLALVMDRMAAVAPWYAYGYGVSLIAGKAFRPLMVHAGYLGLVWCVFFVLWLVVELVYRMGPWFRPDYAAAWLDLHNRAGGRILAGQDQTLATLPKLKPHYLLVRMVWPAFFVAAAFMVPAAQPGRRTSGIHIEQRLAGLEDAVSWAEDSRALSMPDATDLRRQIMAVRELAQHQPEAAAEALQAIRRGVDEAIAGKMERQLAALEKTMTAAQASRGAARGDSDAISKVNAEMLDAWKTMADGEGGLQNLDPEVRAALESALAQTRVSEMGNGSALPKYLPGQMGSCDSAAMLKTLADSIAASCQTAEVGQGKTSGEFGGTQSFSSSGTGEQMARIGSLRDELAALTAQARDGIGAGGIDRGGRSAPLTFSNESDTASERFPLQALPKSDGNAPGIKVAEERGAPPEDAPSGEWRSGRSGRQNNGPVRAGALVTRLGPRRAKAAERYFSALHQN